MMWFASLQNSFCGGCDRNKVFLPMAAQLFFAIAFSVSGNPK